MSVLCATSNCSAHPCPHPAVVLLARLRSDADAADAPVSARKPTAIAIARCPFRYFMFLHLFLFMFLSLFLFFCLRLCLAAHALELNSHLAIIDKASLAERIGSHEGRPFGFRVGARVM